MSTTTTPTVAHPAEGTWEPGLAWLSAGSGRPLLFLPGISARHGHPTGFDRRFTLRTMRPYATRRQVWWVNRRTHLPRTTTMGDIADDYAAVVDAHFDGPVDVLGFSTGGTVALHLAARAPDRVRRVVVVSAAHRLGPLGRAAQRAAAEALRAGHVRLASAALFTPLGTGVPTRLSLGLLGLALGPPVFGSADSDMLATLEAEDAADVRDRLGAVTAPTLLLGGERDGFVGRALYERTAELLPRGELRLWPRKGHLPPHRPGLARAASAFLDTAPPGSPD